MSRYSDIHVFFEPKSVAVIGASPKPGSLGRTIVENLKMRFRGKVYPVNPKYKEILGLKSYPSIKDINDRVDLAVIAVRADLSVKLAEEAAEGGVRGLIVISGGFAEAGEEGRKLQEKLLEIKEKYGVRILGPNCIGVYNAIVGLDTFFLPYDRMKRPHKGPVAIISQSGAFLASVMDWAAEEGIGISKAINFGNKVDVDEIDLIRYFADDDDIRVMIVYLEGIKAGKGREFIDVAREATVKKGKSIVLLKTGKTGHGARAAYSHTAALAGSYEVFKAAFRQARIIEVDEPLRLFDVAKALSYMTPPKGKRVGVLTNAGGPGVIATDALSSLGLEVPRFSRELQEKLRSMFPPRVAVGNPVDLTGDAGPEEYKRALDVLVRSDEIDMLLIIALMQPPTMDISVADTIANYAWKNREKPVVVVTIGSEYAKKFKMYLENRGIPVYDFPDKAAFALYALSRCTECRWGFRKVYPQIELEKLDESNENKAKDIIKNALSRGSGKLLEHESLEVLRLYGLPVPEFCLARSAQELEDCISVISPPYVMKVVSPDIIHKSDVGGVILNIEDSDQAMTAYRKILSNVKARAPDARIHGVLVQKMLPQGLEVIVGGKRDPIFGPVILFGLGGIFVEVLKDVSMRVAPLTVEDSMEMIEEIKAKKLLEGYRGQKPRDKEALATVILKIARLMLRQPAVRELDLNPVMSYEKGAAIADARIVVG